LNDFLKDRGARAHAACPRCGSDEWNKNANDDARVLVEIDPVKLRLSIDADSEYRLAFDCSNYGYIENFNAGPFKKWLLDKLKKGSTG